MKSNLYANWRVKIQRWRRRKTWPLNQGVNCRPRRGDGVASSFIVINWRRFMRVFVLGVVSSLLARRLIFPHLLFHRLYRVASDYKLANRGGSSRRRWKRLSANLLVGCVISWRNLRRYAVSRFQGSRKVERCRGGREYARQRH